MSLWGNQRYNLVCILQRINNSYSFPMILRWLICSAGHWIRDWNLWKGQTWTYGVSSTYGVWLKPWVWMRQSWEIIQKEGQCTAAWHVGITTRKKHAKVHREKRKQLVVSGNPENNFSLKHWECAFTMRVCWIDSMKKACEF